MSNVSGCGQFDDIIASRCVRCILPYRPRCLCIMHGATALYRVRSLCTHIVNDDAWGYDKRTRKDVEWVLGWFIGLHHFKIATDAMATKDGKNPRCQHTMTEGVVSARVSCRSLIITTRVWVSWINRFVPYVWQVRDKGQWTNLSWEMNAWVTVSEGLYETSKIGWLLKLITSSNNGWYEASKIGW